MIIIRTETKEDIQKIREINVAAFPKDDEANLVDALRKNEASIISLRFSSFLLFSRLVELRDDTPPH